MRGSTKPAPPQQRWGAGPEPPGSIAHQRADEREENVTDTAASTSYLRRPTLQLALQRREQRGDVGFGSPKLGQSESRGRNCGPTGRTRPGPPRARRGRRHPTTRRAQRGPPRHLRYRSTEIRRTARLDNRRANDPRTTPRHCHACRKVRRRCTGSYPPVSLRWFPSSRSS